MFIGRINWGARLRKPVLYPAELRARSGFRLCFERFAYGYLFASGAKVPSRDPTDASLLYGSPVHRVVRQNPLSNHRSIAYALPVIWLVVVLLGGTACSSPISPSAVSGFLGASPATTGPGAASVSGSPAPMPPSPPAVTSPSCPVTDEDTHHARRLLRILTGELQRGVTLRFDMEEVPYTSPRELHGFLNVGTAGELQQLLQVSLEKHALKFGSPEAAGYALWNAAGELTITADIYVNGEKVQGCTVRTGKITGRIDLDGL